MARGTGRRQGTRARSRPAPVGGEPASFRACVYEVLAGVPHGRVTTYGAIARALGEPHRAREVGWALFSTPDGHKLPTHRVVNSRGALSGGWAFGGDDVQRARLEAERVPFLPDGRVDLTPCLWRPEPLAATP